jgi:TonB family protein
MDPAVIAEQRQKTEEFMLRGQPDHAVSASHMVIPIYPREMEPEKLAGSATVRCRIDASGKLVETRVVEATHPAFGEAALAAVRQWEFGAAVKNHHFVESNIEIPFNFKPPPPPAASH